MALLTVGRKAQSRVVRSDRVIIRVTRVAIRGNGLESPTYMAAYTIQAGMSADERKEVVLETAAAPARGSMTPFTAGCPAVRNVVRGYGLGEISLVTQLALHRSPPELTDRCLEVTALTGSYCVCGYEMETGIGMLCDQSGWSPVQLFVASLAIQA